MRSLVRSIHNHVAAVLAGLCVEMVFQMLGISRCLELNNVRLLSGFSAFGSTIVGQGATVPQVENTEQYDIVRYVMKTRTRG